MPTEDEGKNEAADVRQVHVTDRMRNRYIAIIMAIAVVLIVVMVYL